MSEVGKIDRLGYETFMNVASKLSAIASRSIEAREPGTAEPIAVMVAAALAMQEMGEALMRLVLSSPSAPFAQRFADIWRPQARDIIRALAREVAEEIQH